LKLTEFDLVVYMLSQTARTSQYVHHHRHLYLIFKAHEMSKLTQIKAGTNSHETALMVALKIHINASIKHQRE